MKKETIHSEEERLKPRIPEDGRKRIHRGGAHKNKKKYDRKRGKKNKGEEVSEMTSSFFYDRMNICLISPLL